ncbi:MAG: hypothetical protein OXE77_03475 [Flavobacteriaceae bacterium]|nr:hypothetical protein [Flavobacteriaceae bacterium]MCY4266663.1 hypothetical protein [Flavobacteriaceae bacterium]MCY4299376.1 hypothetical protein [Flavobacteriaceae bacterium]
MGIAEHIDYCRIMYRVGIDWVDNAPTYKTRLMDAWKRKAPSVFSDYMFYQTADFFSND